MSQPDRCPTCGSTDVEPHPRKPIDRCGNCKEHLPAADLPVVPDGVPATSDHRCDHDCPPVGVGDRLPVPATSDEDVYEDIDRWLAVSARNGGGVQGFRAAVDEARRAERERIVAGLRTAADDMEETGEHDYDSNLLRSYAKRIERGDIG